MTKGKTVASAIIFLLLVAVVPHFTHITSGRLCNCVQYTNFSQPRSSENIRAYREGQDRIQTDKTTDRLMIRIPPKNKVRISDRLAHYLEQINITFGHAKDLIREAYRIATEEENYTPEDAKNLLLENITIFSKRTIYSSLPDECKDLTQQQRRLNKRKSVAKLQPLGQQETEKAKVLQYPTNTDAYADMQKSYNDNGLPKEESNEVKRELGQKQNSIEQRRDQITEFKLSGDMMDEFLSYIGMISKEDYCLGWIYDGKLIDWEISPVLEGRMQVTDKPGRINRRKKRLELEKNSIDNDSLAGKTV
ncbi:MAG: hypothetical protein GEU26_11950 [Nitrososphaeraceae archaeon]|nr:hypothetical protein [Nitrososphaeraceae archaeon]